MPDEAKCKECGATLDAGTAGGLCPNCLMKVGMQSQSKAGSVAQEPSQPAKPRFAVPPLDELAKNFPQLEILEFLGQGGMGMVYKVRQRQLGRLAALKLLPAEVAQDPRFAERFTREARALAALTHPNIVAVYDFGQTVAQAPSPANTVAQAPSPANPVAQAPSPANTAGGGCATYYYILMEYVDGTDLRHVLQTQSLSAKEALVIVPQVCEALQYAHNEGIVHRDIKPENILLDKRGRVKIADFGLAKLLGIETPPGTLTSVNQILGTAPYMAPEQIERPTEIDHRVDIYSLGVIIYEMLTGELPLGRFAPPSRKVQVDVRLDEVVLKALAKEPDLRYQQASEVKTEVEAIAQNKAAAQAQPVVANENTWALFQHLSQFCGYLIPLAGLLVPFILWQVKKNESPLLDRHGRIVANWILTKLILYVVFILLCFVFLIGVPFVAALAICDIVFPILGAFKANNGEVWRYPFSIEFFCVKPDAKQFKPLNGCLVMLIIVLIILALMFILGSLFFFVTVPRQTSLHTSVSTPDASVEISPFGIKVKTSKKTKKTPSATPVSRADYLDDLEQTLDKVKELAGESSLKDQLPDLLESMEAPLEELKLKEAAGTVPLPNGPLRVMVARLADANDLLDNDPIQGGAMGEKIKAALRQAAIDMKTLIDGEEVNIPAEMKSWQPLMKLLMERQEKSESNPNPAKPVPVPTQKETGFQDNSDKRRVIGEQIPDSESPSTPSSKGDSNQKNKKRATVGENIPD